MRWENAISTSSMEVYYLWQGDKKLLTLTLHPFSNTARVDCENERRVFLIRKEGFRRNKTVLRTEYGMKMGELGVDETATFIDINHERFYYNISTNNKNELILYKEKIEDPFVICALDLNNGDASVSFSNDSISSHPELLMALCWYMFLPVTKENIAAAAL